MSKLEGNIILKRQQEGGEKDKDSPEARHAAAADLVRVPVGRRDGLVFGGWRRGASRRRRRAGRAAPVREAVPRRRPRLERVDQGVQERKL